MIFRRKTQQNTRRAARRGGRRLRMESLEKRLPMAGNVAAAVFGGNLLITGDLDDNDITIAHDGVPGRVEITPNGTTTLNGVGASQTFQATGDIRIRMRDGSDSVVYNGLGGSTPRDLMVDLGDGDNTFSLDNYTLGRNLYVRSRDGFDNILVDNVSAFNMAIDIGDGGGLVNVVNGSTIVNDLRLTGRDGDVTMTVDSDGIGGDVTIRNGDGAKNISLIVPTIGDDLLISNGDGDVLLSVDGADVGDDAVIRNGEGFHDLTLLGASFGDDVTVRNGAGGGSITVDLTDILGNLNITNADATDTTVVNSFVGVNICVHDGAGEGSLSVVDSEVGGDVMQSSRDGDYDVLVDGSDIGDDVATRNGDGDNTIALLDSDVEGDVIISNRDGDNTITLGADGEPLDVGGRVLVRNGDGDNTISAEAADIALDLLMRNGDALAGSTLTVGTIAPVNIGRDLLVLARDGGLAATINAVTIGRNLSITTGDGADDIIATGTAVGDLTVGFYTSIRTDGDDDELFIGTDTDGVTVLTDRVRIGMGGEADTAVIGEGTVMDILNAFIDGGPGAVDVLTVTNSTAFDPFLPVNAARLRNWELIFD